MLGALRQPLLPPFASFSSTTLPLLSLLCREAAPDSNSVSGKLCELPGRSRVQTRPLKHFGALCCCSFAWPAGIRRPPYEYDYYDNLCE